MCVDRRRPRFPRVLCLTGSIGMGKSTAARAFRRLGVPVHDSDAAVHRLLARGGAAVRPVGEAFPGVVVDGAVDRKALGARVFGDPPALARLEAIVHPLLRHGQRTFLERARREGRGLVLFDIPLLFESRGRRGCDLVVVVSAPSKVQRARVMRRPGMTEARFQAILARQTPDRMKRRLADIVLPTGLGKRETLRHIVRLKQHLAGMAGRTCARSCSTRKPPGAIRPPATASSKSA